MSYLISSSQYPYKNNRQIFYFFTESSFLSTTLHLFLQHSPSKLNSFVKRVPFLLISDCPQLNSILKKIGSMLFKFIQTNESLVVTRFGKLNRVGGPGIRFYIPFIEETYRISNRLYVHSTSMNVRTQDKVFPKLDISIQYRIKHEDSAKAMFQMEDPLRQLDSYTDNIVRKAASEVSLDDLFESQSHLADRILNEAGPKMKEGGYTLESVQIRSINPPDEVMRSMNEINAAMRRKTAAEYDGQAAKIKIVKNAEADAAEKELRGKGVAMMRKNITQGWVQSIKEMSTRSGIAPIDVLKFLTKILQQETMESMSKNAGTKVIFMDKSEGSTTGDYLNALEAHDYQEHNEAKK